MAQSRMLHKKVTQSLQLADVSLQAAHLFVLLIPHLDCEGRFPGDPRQIWQATVSLREDFSIADVSDCLAELHAAKLIKWYEVDGIGKVIWYPKFLTYQRIRREKSGKPSHEAESRLPAPPDTENWADGLSEALTE